MVFKAEGMLKARIGLIGVGLMGHGIALNLLKHGHRLGFLAHPGNQPVEALLGAGAVAQDTARQIAQGSDILILCVPGSPEVEQVLTGPQGLIEGLHPGAIVVDCSTALPESTLRMAARVREAGAAFLDAPMTRTAQHAREGRLNLLVGGEAKDLARIEPVLRCFAENITLAGPVGAGHRLKLLHNFVSLGSAALIAEAAACADRGGTDPQVFIDVLASGGGAGVALDRLRPYILRQDSSGLQFHMGHALKDLAYYAQMAGGLAAAHRIGDAVAGTYREAVERRGAQAMVPELVSVLAEAGKAR